MLAADAPQAVVLDRRPSPGHQPLLLRAVRHRRKQDMTYKEKLATIVDLEASRLLELVKLTGASTETMEKLERLCRCAKILGDEEAPEGDDDAGEEELLTVAQG